MEDKEILSMHAKNQGVLNIAPQFEVKNRKELGEAYTPGVAIISKLIERYPELKDKYTLSGKLVALVTDGSAVLGLGNIGPAGGLPVVEGKALLYKDLANVNALPLTVEQVPVNEFVATLKNMQESFAGFHLEDIKAPRCFEIEEKLSKVVNIPVYHDDQEGTAIVVLAGLINAARVVKKNLKDLKVIINGVGASGVATARLLFAAGIKNITFVDIAPNGLKKIKKQIPNSNIVVSRAENLVTLTNSSYDMYISLRTYNSSFFNIKQAISEAFRVLKKDGIIIISIANGFLCPEDQYIIPGLIVPGTEFVDIYRGFDMIEKLSRQLCNNSFKDIQFFPTKVELFITAKAKK